MIYNFDSYNRVGETLRVEIQSATNAYFNYTYVTDTFYFATASDFCDYVKRILDSFNPTFIFVVSEDALTHRITIQINLGTQGTNNNKFRLFLGSCPQFASMLGLETSNTSVNTSTVTGTKAYNLTGQMSSATVDLKTLLDLTSVRLDFLSVDTTNIYNISDNNNRIVFQVKTVASPTVEVSHTVYLPSGRYTPSEFAAVVTTSFNTATGGNDFLCSYSTTTRRLTFERTVGSSVSTYRILWTKSHTSLTRMCGFNRDAGVAYRGGSIVGSMVVDFEYPKNIYVHLDNIQYVQPILNNRLTFLVNVDMRNPLYTQTIHTKSTITSLTVRLYDEYGMLLPIQSHWRCVFSLND